MNEGLDHILEAFDESIFSFELSRVHASLSQVSQLVEQVYSCAKCRNTSLFRERPEFRIIEMDTWFEIVLSLFAFVYLILEIFKCSMMIEDVPELTDEMKSKLYS